VNQKASAMRLISFLKIIFSISLIGVSHLSLSIKSASAESRQLKVGISLPLTGMAAGMGEAFRNGIQLFQQAQAEKASHLEVFFDDHAYDGKKAISSLNFLRTQKGADVVVTWGNTPTEVVAPIAESRGIPLLGLAMDPHGKDRKNVVTFGPAESESTPKMKEFFEAKKSKTPAILSVNVGNALVIAKRLQELLPELQIVEFVPTESTDFAPIIQKFKQKGVDAALTFLLPEQASIFAQQAATQHFDIPVLGPDIWAQEELLKKLFLSFSDVSFVYVNVSDAFQAQYFKAYGKQAFLFEAASGYEVASLLSKLSPEVLQKKSFEEALAPLPLQATAIPNLRFAVFPGFGKSFRCSAEVIDGKTYLTH
jgi:ABC-type branched-subunit amino acid transport system substrate-binding protein